MLVLKNDHLEKITPIFEGIFQIGQFGMELWDKMFNFEGNIGLFVLKIVIFKK